MKKTKKELIETISDLKLSLDKANHYLEVKDKLNNVLKNQLMQHEPQLTEYEDAFFFVLKHGGKLEIKPQQIEMMVKLLIKYHEYRTKK